MSKELAIGKNVYNVDDDIVDEPPFEMETYINDLNREKMINFYKSEVRNSFEYRTLIDTFKNVLDVKSCVFFKDFSLNNGMKLEFHHHPFTMQDYVETVVNKHLKINGGFVYDDEVEIEVARLHYKLNVGLVPLNPTAHAQVHDGLLDIHKDLIIGYPENFLSEYNGYISDSIKQKYEMYLELNIDSNKLQYPDNFKYKPTIIKANNKNLITTKDIDKILIEDKLNRVNNVDIDIMLRGLNGGK